MDNNKSLLKAYMFIVLIAFFVLINVVTPTSKEIDKSINVHYTHYMRLVDEFCTKDQYFNPISYNITLKSLERPYIGFCHYIGSYYEITLSRSYWMTSSDDDRFQLLAHELTHCLFEAEHTDDPNNFMYASHSRTMTMPEIEDQVRFYLSNTCKK